MGWGYPLPLNRGTEGVFSPLNRGVGGVYKSRSIITLTEIHLEGILILWELGEVFLSDFLFYLFLLRGINEGDAGTLEACPRETTAIDAVGGEHSFVDSNEFWTTTLIVVDATLARSLDKATEPLQVT